MRYTGTNPAKTPHCPLCGGNRSIRPEQIDGPALLTLYNSFLGADIQDLLSGIESIHLLQCVDCDLMFTWPFVPGDERFYELVSLKEDYYPAVKSEFEIASQQIGAGDYVLDIGCGVGEFAGVASRYTGIDINEKALAVARRKGLDAVKATIEEHAKAHAQRYDAVVAFHVLEHVTRPNEFLEAALGCLRTGGKLVVAVPSAESFITRMENHLLNLPPHHLTWWTDTALRSIARLNAVELLQIYHEPVQDNHFEPFVHTYYLDMFRRLMGVERRLVNLHPNIRQRIANRLARYLGNVTKPFLRPKAARSIGHTVTVVYQKT